jgi:Nif-specific regulatory protein
MPTGAKAYLVLRHPDGVGNVFPLHQGKRYNMGRAKTNEIVLDDDLCSRTHAEVYYVDGQWRVRDCGSLNGVRINGMQVDKESELMATDEVGVGNSRLIFVENLSQLPPIPGAPKEAGGGVTIRKKMGQTRFDIAPDAVHPSTGKTPVPHDRPQRLRRDLSILYRLALDMGAAATPDELITVVIRGLLEATVADAAAVLAIKEGRQHKLLDYENKNDEAAYIKMPPNIATEVVSIKEGVLAEDADRLRPRENAGGVATSLICAPVLVGDKVESIIHLYCTDPMKSLSVEDLELTVAVGKQFAVGAQVLRREQELREENQRLKAQVATEVQLVGTSRGILDIEAQITRVGPTNATVLIRGESGAGKELVARAIHLASPRRQGPFVCLNCAALAESLLESELFGHEKGAFTGATDRKIGKFEAAHGGTIFLDEIGEMNPGAQAKLLRILEGHPYERVGGIEPIRVNVRVVAATNRPLEEAVNAGQFRRDLYFRLQVVEIRVPPLRDRQTDIPLLADHFLQKFLQETGRKIRGFTPAAMEKLAAYHWPGNIRELRNIVERAVALSNGPMIDTDDVWLSNIEALNRPPGSPGAAYTPATIEELEKQHIQATLKFTDWNKSQAAGILGIERSTLDRKIKGYDIKR